MPLTDIAIRQAKATEKPFKLSDGGGLHLLVTPRGGKLWRLAYRFDGKQRQLAFGGYPEVTLKDARARRDAAKDQISATHGKGVILQLLGDWIAHECRRGRLDVPDPKDAARMLMDMVAGSITQGLDGRLAWDGSDRRRAYVRECIRVFLSGTTSAR